MLPKQAQSVSHTSRWLFILNLGFFAGLIWGLIKIMFYYLGFTKVIPGFLADPFFKHAVLANWTGHLIGWLFFIVFSFIAATIYLLLFQKVKGPWLGIGYGIGWWALLYLAIGPLTGMVKRIDRLDINSIMTDLCLFTLWGVFIGYTIALEFTDERKNEPFSNFDSPQK